MVDDSIAMAVDDSEVEALARPAPPGRAVDRMQEALIARLGGKQKSIATRTVEDESASNTAHAEPTQLGRFEVRGRLGAGAMGVVYEAFDPKLNRRVAVKLLQPDRASPSALARVRREAQALARLSHPNVVQVFAIGSAGEDVYVAMELIEGETLRHWQGATLQPWREVLEVYTQAGEGLCAIHEAGLVHRDFKPANVMRDRRGRVRVLDLGLVRGDAAAGPVDPSTAGVSIEGKTGGTSGSETRTDAVLGTPAYMAPEQFLGRVATAASDQFSFCVAVFEALYGARPFKATTPLALIEAMMAGKLEPAPAKTDVPSRVYEALRRGLSHHADDRYGSLRELLSALHAPGRSSRALWLGALGFGALAAAWGGYAMTQAQVPCAGVEQLQAVWNPQSRADVEAAFPAADVTSSLAALDAHAVLLREDAEAACGGAAVDDRSLLCHRASRQRFAAALDVLVETGGEAAAHARRVVAALAPPGCDRAPDGGPVLSEAQAEQAVLASQLKERAKMLGLASRFEDAAVASDAAVEAAHRSGDPRALSGALEKRAGFRIREGKLREAQPDFEAAYAAALIARDDGGAAMSALGLTWVSLELGEVEAARRWVRLAESSLEQSDSFRLKARLEQRLGQVALARGNVDAGAEHLERGLAMFEELDDKREIATLLSDLQLVAMSRGDIDLALDYAQRAVAEYEDAFGPHDAQLGSALHNLGNVWERKGETQHAYDSHLRGLRIREAALGPKHGLVGISAYAVSVDLVALKRVDEAMVMLARVRECLPAEHPAIAAATLVRADIEARRGNVEDAVRLTERALVAFESMMGPEHPNVAEVRLAKADLLRMRGKFAEALLEAQRSSAVFIKHYGPNHPLTGKALGAEGAARKLLGQRTEALTAYREAIRVVGAIESMTSAGVGVYQTSVAELLLEEKRYAEARVAAEAGFASEVSGAERGVACFVLARVLRRQATDAPRQQALAKEAEALWSEADETDLLAELSTWRAHRG